jgi:quercetin dioxygenase-like cupin family protein
MEGTQDEAAGGLTGRVMRLADLVEYRQSSVVSRGVITKEAGTVTLFAFDQDQGLSEHTAPFDALAWVLDGQAEITIAGKRLRLEAGEMVIMPAGKPHAVRAITPFKMVLVMIKS